MQARITTTGQVRATDAGEIALTLRGPGGCRAAVTLKSQRRIPSRWLERGRARCVTLARRAVTLPPAGHVELILRLKPEHLALLRRMGAIRAVARVETAQSRSRTAVIVHAPAWPRKGARRAAAGGARSHGARATPTCTMQTSEPSLADSATPSSVPR
jgi:hypothetical protein